MTTHVAIQAPIVEDGTVELASNARIFRKTVLRAGSINYQGRRLDFTPDYLDQLAAAHREKAFDTVPLVFAPSDNSHTQDVERIRGEVLGFERNGDRLDAVIRAANEQAARQLRENPNIGVSVRIEQPIERADGKKWPAAVQHVLATANPKINGLGPWQPINLSADDRPVIDLSVYEFTAPTGDNQEGNTMTDTQVSPFTEEETAKLRALLAQATNDDDTGEADDEPTDEELDALAAQLFADDDDEEAPVEVAAASDAQAIELARENAALRDRIARLEATEAETRFERLRDRLATDKGVPPAVTELAKPVLMLDGNTIELSNGGKLDVADVMRKVIVALADAKLVDLARSADDTVYAELSNTGDDDKASERAAAAARYLSEYGLL